MVCRCSSGRLRREVVELRAGLDRAGRQDGQHVTHAHGQRLGIDVVGATKVGLEVAIAAPDGGHLHLDVGPVAGGRERLVRDGAAAVRMLDHQC